MSGWPLSYPHRKDDYITKMIPYDYDPDATCPRFENFLFETFNGNLALVGYVIRLMGYCCTGLTTEQKWWMFVGPTASGKSTLLRVLHGILGPYAMALPDNYFLLSHHDNKDFITGNLHGVRLATCVETNEGKRLNVAKIKMLTGEDPISAELKYQNAFTFKPQCKLILATNYPPRIPAGDDAIWRRLKVVPFTRTLPENQWIKGLADELIAQEAPGIMNQALHGCRAWQRGGLQEPPEVADAVGAYRTAEDIVNDCLKECFDRDDNPETKTRRQVTLAIVNKWAQDNHYSAFNGKKLGKELDRLGIKGDKGDRFWLGIRPKDPFVLN
jgi:putative DNA primase/helicase